MIFRETKLEGAYIIDLEPIRDHRGFFADSFSEEEFAHNNLESVFVRSAVAFNPTRFTLRGMHYQISPHEEVKLVRCSRGAIYDVIVDMRPSSPTYKEWVAVELNQDNPKVFYVPAQFAHGYLTLTDDAEVSYQISRFYNEEAQRGIRYNDPAVGIEWPTYPNQISWKDMGWELLK